MNAAADRLGPVPGAAAHAALPAQVALLGTGTVGRAVLERLVQWRGTQFGERLSLVYAANSRLALQDPRGLCGDDVRQRIAGGAAAKSSVAGAAASVGTGNASAALPCSSELDAVAPALRRAATRIVIDATASESVASCHAGWLNEGIHVVTACKLGQGGALSRSNAIRDACVRRGSIYGDSATVGAGLPVIRSLRELQAGGDRIHAVAGVLSGSLAWLFNRFDGLRPFSGFVREARAAGFTEPDPRDDLSGEDVRRKIVILARAAGVGLEPADVEVESLVPNTLATLPLAALDVELAQLDAPLRERFARAYRNGEKLRFIARLDVAAGHARVGLESLPNEHPLAGGAGTDNRVAVWSDRYSEQPLVIQGPGAGAQVTAAALLDDALRIAAQAHRN
ncbi:MAG: Aspartokinase / Homoserine dehydrogenase [uncultured Lysobacter sp.]|uniref:Homoserine dehydrogenase n=1 Tax=uncultured Lysobacter sp. TaxID=271060 RepID=A0A6J4LHN0_9GAMM|nr:MAG: Aspartokinase / Homoserine dehydrogenase [uncultured Lysobacter sp.]